MVVRLLETAEEEKSIANETFRALIITPVVPEH